MRVVLTILAVALVAVLSVALAAPLFIDWSAHREEIAARLGAMTGGDVSLGGPVTLRLLPTPYLEVGEGSVTGRGQDAPHLTFASARLELALVKLASGAIRFSEIKVEKPVLTIARAPDGSLKLPVPPAGESDAIGFDRLLVHDGRIRIVGGGENDIEGVQLDADAQSLAGPYHVSGQFAGPGGAPVVFRLASERSGPAGLPIRLSVDHGSDWPGLEFDGALTASGAAGMVTLSGTAPGGDGPLPWLVTGQMTADFNRATLQHAELRLGPEERAVRADGSAIVSFGSPSRLSVAFNAKQANLDALLRRKGEEGVAPASAVALLSGAAASAFDHPSLVTIDAKLSADTVILGSGTLSGLSGAFRSAPGAPLRTRFDLGLPGASRLSGDGELEQGEAARVKGSVDFTSSDFGLLRDWASQGSAGFGAKAAQLGDAFAYRKVSLSGQVDASAVGFSGRDLKIALDRSTFAGSLAFTLPVGADPGRLYLDISSDSLDVDSLPNPAAAASLLGDLDLACSLRAKALHVAEVNGTEINSGSFALELTKKGREITLDRLNIADLGGAFVDATGSIGRDGLAATGRLRTDRLRDFAVLVSRLAPGEWTRTLAARADFLSPTNIAFEAHGPTVSDGAPTLSSLKATGAVGKTQATLSLDPGPKGNGQILTLNLDSPDGAALLRQLGLSGATAANGGAHVALHGSGSSERGYDLDASGALAGADLSGRGRYLPLAEGDAAWLFGAVKLKAASISPLLSAFGLAPASPAIGPVEAGADVTLRGDRWTLSRISATVAGVKAMGDLSYEPSPNAEAQPSQAPDVVRDAELLVGAVSSALPPPSELTGSLSFDRMPLSDILALTLGPASPTRSGTPWSAAKFAPQPLNTPRTSIHVSVGALDLLDGGVAQGFAADVRLDKGRLDLDDIGMKIDGGTASGHATLRRDNEIATLTGALRAEQLAIARPGLSGRIGGTLEFASTGRSPAALIEGLAGSGTARFAGVALSRSDPAAVDRVVAREQAADAQLDETNVAYALGAELDKGPLSIPDGAAPIALSAGVIKFGPITIARPRGDAALTGSLDLRRFALNTRLAITSAAAGLKFWSALPPSATVTVEDALEAPKRQLDVGALAAGLATQAIARESDRIANLEADIRERAFFNRRLKGERFLDRRAAEIEDWKAEQERLKGLSERLAAERAEAQKAAEQAAAEKAAAERAAAERAAAEKAAAEKAAAEKVAAERAALERAAAEKAEADRAAEKRAAAEKAEADKERPTLRPELPPELPPESAPIPQPPASDSAIRGDEFGVNSSPHAPLPPARPKPRPPTDHTTAPDPTASGFY